MLIHTIMISSVMLVLSIWLCYYALADFTEQDKQKKITASCPTPSNPMLAHSGKRYE